MVLLVSSAYICTDKFSFSLLNKIYSECFWDDQNFANVKRKTVFERLVDLSQW